MHKIKLVVDKVFYNQCKVDVYDVTDGKDQERCKIDVDYSMADVHDMQEKNMDHADVMEYYREWIYDVVRHYILDDWECTEGMDEVLSIVDEHIGENFDK